MKDQEASAVLLCPLFGQAFYLSAEERKAARKLVFENRHDPAVQALYNLIERTAYRLQGEGIAPGSGPHDQGQACGALHVANVARAWLEAEVPEV
jgi:hypothetical protein